MTTDERSKVRGIDCCFCPSVAFQRKHASQPTFPLLQSRHPKPNATNNKRYGVMSHPQPAGKKAQVRRWRCMSQCGACCKLDEYDEDVLKEMLNSEEDVVEYLGMIGKDGWCKWLDSFTRTCTKYDDRPRFCRATPGTFYDLYGVDPSEFDEFAISCCEFHIENSYGAESQEVARYSVFKDLPSVQHRTHEG